MSNEEESVEQILADALAWIDRERPRAGFFAWPDRQLAERGIACTFAEAARSEPGFPLRNIASYKPDPPDCLAEDVFGRRVALEVTELVDAEANARAKRDRSRFIVPDWDQAKFESHLRERLRAKDTVHLNGGPYAEYIVIVHCDELVLGPDTVREYLEAVKLEPFGQISRAFLLLSYDSARGGYPYFCLHRDRTG